MLFGFSSSSSSSTSPSSPPGPLPSSSPPSPLRLLALRRIPAGRPTPASGGRVAHAENDVTKSTTTFSRTRARKLRRTPPT
eukprot:1070668-Prorocentrum_minimum.AAC.4